MKKKSLKFIQLSDTHLYASSEETLCGLKTFPAFEEAVIEMKRYRKNLDFILATGDISQDRSPKSYLDFGTLMRSFQVPVYCLPGNHDDPSLMRDLFLKGPVQYKRHIVFEDWQIVALNSTVPMENRGHFEPEELDEMASYLDLYPRKHALVSFHHNPIPLGSPWLDKMTVDNADQFFDRLSRHPNVKAVVFGHVHQEFQSQRNGFLLLGAPSTSIQFKPQNPTFSLDNVNPGFRLFELHDDGRLETRVIRLPSFSQTPDLSSPGY